MNTELKNLEEEFKNIIIENNGRETQDAKELKEKYKKLNRIVMHPCMECGGIASIDCQFH